MDPVKSPKVFGSTLLAVRCGEINTGIIEMWNHLRTDAEEENEVAALGDEETDGNQRGHKAETEVVDVDGSTPGGGRGVSSA